MIMIVGMIMTTRTIGSYEDDAVYNDSEYDK